MKFSKKKLLKYVIYAGITVGCVSIVYSNTKNYKSVDFGDFKLGMSHVRRLDDNTLRVSLNEFNKTDRHFTGGRLYKFVDDKGNELLADQNNSAHSIASTNYKIELKGDFKDTEYIVVSEKKHQEFAYVKGEEGKLIKFIGEGEIQQKVVEKAEEYQGIVLNNHFIEVPKEQKFYSYEELKGKKINMFDNVNVEIKDVKSVGDETRITFKLPKEVEFYGLIDMLVMDEDGNITPYTAEGYMDSRNDDLYTMGIMGLDSSKKYSIGIPKVEKAVYSDVSMKLKI